MVQQYDKDNKISFSKAPEKFLALSWLHFQMSGQGPYMGQQTWFTHFQPGNKQTAAIERYAKETKRILGVLELQLSGGVKKTGEREWLVGNKCSYADLVFVPWNNMLGFIHSGAPEGTSLDFEKEFPKTYAWHQRMVARPAVAKALKVQAGEIAKG